MRRRSERKKSTEVCSTPVSRRTSRRSRKSPETRSEKNVDAIELSQAGKEVTPDGEDNGKASEEQLVGPACKSRARNLTPVKDRSSPAKLLNRNQAASNAKLEVIPDEENVAAANTALVWHEEDEDDTTDTATAEDQTTKPDDMSIYQEKGQETECTTEVTAFSSSNSPKANVEDNMKPLDVLEIQTEHQEDKKLQSHNTENLANTGSIERIAEVAGACCADEVTASVTHSKGHSILPVNAATDTVAIIAEAECIATDRLLANAKDKTFIEIQKLSSNKTSANMGDNGRTRKRKWLTKKTTESTVPVLAISTDSLKNLIADVHPVPLSDVQLESSSEVEEVVSEREEGEETPSPDRESRRVSIDKTEKAKRNLNESEAIVSGHGAKNIATMQRSPSPPRNQTSSVLYITNLVRPFTVLQLKGLLVRTGKIVEDGFWIDRIKSKCYVQYETEDEAIETRHALHGVRWPVSNPKCLNVDFGSKVDMERAIQSTKDDQTKFGQDNNKDNLIVGTGWNRDRNDVDDKKSVRPVREWDVGKKESLDREKLREVEKRRSRERDIAGNRENERSDKERKPRTKGRDQRSSSLSPVRKAKKKESDPPLRLLDDLFRKTKAAPCIYWLPLTPEQIAEKEAFRQKRIEEHKQRIKQRELERGKERNRNDRGKERDREREHRRNRSNERRSRSRDRRRY